MSNTPQGEATEGNTADDALVVDQGPLKATKTPCFPLITWASW
jgi:hypothetical protein